MLDASRLGWELTTISQTCDDTDGQAEPAHYVMGNVIGESHYL